ncbi:hypothetical protein ACFL4T_06585 [candidate division KSB1 bacterium]
MNKKLIKLLYRSFDGSLTEDEEKTLSDALQGSEELRSEKEKIMNLRSLVSGASEKEFSPFFTEKIMNKIESAKNGYVKTNHIDRIAEFIFRRLALIGAAAVILLIAYNFIQTGQITVTGLFGIPEITYEEIIEPVFALN